MAITVNLYCTGKNGAAEKSVRDKYNLHTQAERYPSDESGIPEGDARYLRE